MYFYYICLFLLINIITYVYYIIIKYKKNNLNINYTKYFTDISEFNDFISKEKQFYKSTSPLTILKGNKFISYKLLAEYCEKENIDVNSLDDEKRNILFYLVSGINKHNYKDITFIIHSLIRNSSMYIEQVDIYGNTFMNYFLRNNKIEPYMYYYIMDKLSNNLDEKKNKKLYLMYLKEYYIKGIFLYKYIME